MNDITDHDERFYQVLDIYKANQRISHHLIDIELFPNEFHEPHNELFSGHLQFHVSLA